MSINQNNDPEVQRLQPHSEEIEQIILGIMMLDESKLELLVDLLYDEMFFYNTKHQLIFRAIISLYNHGIDADPLTVAEELKAMQALDEIGGAYYLSQLPSMVSSTAGAEHYAKILESKYLLRKMITICGETIDSAFCADASPEQIIIDSLNNFESLNQSRNIEIQPIENVVNIGLEKLKDRLDAKVGAVLKTGFNDFDRRWGGLLPAQLIIIAGRPSMGKTALALSMTDNMIKGGAHGAFCSLEMLDYQLTDRLICRRGHINGTDLNKGKLKPEDYTKYCQVGEELAKSPLHIQFFDSATVDQITSYLKKLNRQQKIDFAIIDYLDLITLPKAERVDIAIGEISQKLLSLAGKLQIPIILLVQLNREAAKRENKEPQLTDLKNSGCTEQNADVVMFIHREAYYKDKEEDNEEYDSSAKILIRKDRNGDTGYFTLQFIKQYASFENTAIVEEKTVKSWYNNEDKPF